mmetsp:Transcript_33822/g.73151  ORF Transcript_33822/g.73151 Transcript_33822/m.73151 type:complete len:99 (-) Transcript_33822:3927-4223(-)
MGIIDLRIRRRRRQRTAVTIRVANRLVADDPPGVVAEEAKDAAGERENQGTMRVVVEGANTVVVDEAKVVAEEINVILQHQTIITARILIPLKIAGVQ